MAKTRASASTRGDIAPEAATKAWLGVGLWIEFEDKARVWVEEKHRLETMRGIYPPSPSLRLEEVRSL